MSREKEFVKNSAILSIGTIFPKITSIITLPVITGCLSKADYGIYDLITVSVLLVLPVATLQMQAAAFRYLVTARGNREEQDRIITNIAYFTIPVCIVALLLLYLILGLVTKFDSTIRLLVILYFFIDTLLITARQIARGLSMNMVYSVSALIGSVLEMLGMFLMLKVRGGGLHSAVLVLIASQFIAFVYVAIKGKLSAHIRPSSFSMDGVRTLIAYSWPMIPNSLSSWVMRLSDRMILTAFMGAEANAVYAVANKLPNMFNIVQSTFSLAWQENASISVGDKDSGEYYGRMFDNIYNMFVGMMALLIAFTPIFFRILIRGDYSESYNHMPILYIAVLFATISSYLGGIYIAHMKTKEIGITTTLAAATNFLINILFVKRIGIYAASLSTLISYLWLSVYRMFDVQKFQKIRFSYFRIAALTMVLAAMSFVCFKRNLYLDLGNMAFSVVFAFLLNKKIVLTVCRTVLKKAVRRGTEEKKNDSDL